MPAEHHLRALTEVLYPVDRTLAAEQGAIHTADES
jgi:hypothetical protein